MYLHVLLIVLLFAGEKQCTSGFLDSIDESSTIVTLPDSSLSNGDPFRVDLANFRRWIFPNIKFTCDGYVISWTLRVNNSMGSRDTTLIPQITTWRLDSQRFSYRLQNTTLNEFQLNISGGMIEYVPSQPIRVQAGDIVGIRLPSEEDDMFNLMIKPLFLRLPEGNSSAISCIGLQSDDKFFFSNQMCNEGSGDRNQTTYIPLISVVISKLPHCTSHM